VASFATVPRARASSCISTICIRNPIMARPTSTTGSSTAKKLEVPRWDSQPKNA
jgi:hypothetical protein